MNLDWLRTYREVVDLGSFTRAAAALHITQPAVSHHVRNLEAYFGATLIQHDGRTLLLTPDGERAYALAQRVTADIDQFRQSLMRARSEGNQQLVIASLPVLLNYYLPVLLSRFWEQHPDLTISTRAFLDADRVVQAVRDGEVDVAIHPRLPGESPLPSFRCYRAPVSLVCSPEHPLASQRNVRPEHLRCIRVALTNEGSAQHDLIADWFQSLGVQLTDVVELSTLEEIRALALRGLVVSFLPDAMSQGDVVAGRLMRVRLPGFDVAHDVWMTHAMVPEPPLDSFLELARSLAP